MKKTALTLFPLITILLMIWGYHQASTLRPMTRCRDTSSASSTTTFLRLLWLLRSSPSASPVLSDTSPSVAAIRIARRSVTHGRSQGAKSAWVFCTVVLTTGPLWGRRAWGIWWTWDARLTTTLVLWLIYVSYLLLRRFAAGPQMQTLAAVLGIFGALDVPIVYMSNRCGARNIRRRCLAETRTRA